MRDGRLWGMWSFAGREILRDVDFWGFWRGRKQADSFLSRTPKMPLPKSHELYAKWWRESMSRNKRSSRIGGSTKTYSHQNLLASKFTRTPRCPSPATESYFLLEAMTVELWHVGSTRRRFEVNSIRAHFIVWSLGPRWRHPRQTLEAFGHGSLVVAKPKTLDQWPMLAVSQPCHQLRILGLNWPMGRGPWTYWV